MAISQKSTKLLWANAAGRCSFSGCQKKLFKSDDDGAAPYTVGEMAHICGDKTGSNRHDPTQSDIARNDYKNLILLCPDHHTEIDKKENEGIYSVAALRFTCMLMCVSCCYPLHMRPRVRRAPGLPRALS